MAALNIELQRENYPRCVKRCSFSINRQRLKLRREDERSMKPLYVQLSYVKIAVTPAGVLRNP